MGTNANARVFTYEATAATKVDTTEISAPIVEIATNTTILSASDQIAAYFAEDLAALVTRTHLRLYEALKGPPQFGADPALFLRLICADINQLLSDQLILGIMLILSDPIENDESRFSVRYRAEYHLKRSLALTSGGEGTADQTRTGGTVDPSSQVGNQTRFSLVVNWNPARSGNHVEFIKYPRYHFQWVPTSYARFDDRYLAPVYRYGSITSTEGEWMLNRLEHAMPEALRRRRTPDAMDSAND